VYRFSSFFPYFACRLRDAAVNPKINRVDTNSGYRFESRPQKTDKDSRVILAFSGPNDNRMRLLDQVEVITGVIDPLN
jgi:hypothetical protein